MTLRGKVTISLDFEAGWGVIGNGRWRMRESEGVYAALRPALRRFVAHLDATEVSCIWAVVGGMIDTPSRISLSHLKGGYRDKAAQFLAEAKPSTKDGRDLLETVLMAKCPQHFGSHGYSHVLFSDPDQDQSVFAAEMERAQAANASFGLPMRFFVFPENRFGFLSTVQAAGVEIVRMPAWGVAGKESTLRRRLSAVLRSPHPVVDRPDSSGLRLHHATALLNWGAGAGAIKTGIVRYRVEHALRAARNGAHVHFWLHPFNLVETRGLQDYIEDVLRRLAQWRDSGMIEISTLDLSHDPAPRPVVASGLATG